jgi:hypothetical protein
MQDLPLQFSNGHLFLQLATDLWLLDTGAPWSFGRYPDVTVAEERFPVGDDYLGLTAEQLSGFVGAECAGLLGGDVLGRFDWIFDVPGARVTVAADVMALQGDPVSLEEFIRSGTKPSGCSSIQERRSPTSNTRPWPASPAPAG